MLKLTESAKQAARATHLKPNLVFQIDGFDLIFAALQPDEYIRIGDPGLVIGNDWQIGGLKPTTMGSALPYVSFTYGGSTTSKITQQLSPDRSQGSSNTTMTVSILDKAERISQLISPGFDLNDIIGKNAAVYLGFIGTAYPQDYFPIFRGVIQGVDSLAGTVNFLLANTEEKKRAGILAPRTWPLNGAMGTAPITDILLTNPSLFAQAVTGPDGNEDPSIEYYVKIDDEIFKYTGASPGSLTGVSRSQFGSTAAEHSDDADIQSMYRLQGNGIDLALKLMLSGWNGPFVEDIPVKNFVQVTPLINADDSIYLEGIDVEKTYGLAIGDYVTITGASNGANNVTAQIIDMQITEEGTILILNAGATMVVELASSALASFRSQYDTLGQGLRLTPNEVDIAEHQRLRQLFLSSFEFDFRLDEIPNTKEFIEKQIYLPMSCFSIPRKARSSISIHVGPIASGSITILSAANVCNADKLRLSRSTSSYFANTIKYSYDFDVVAGKYRTVKVYESTDSKARIPIGDKTLAIDSEGMRTDLDAVTQSGSAADRYLGRYQYGAEHIKGIQVLFGIGFPLEIGDIVGVNFASLKLTDVNTGTRSGGIKLFEVINKSDDIKNGQCLVDIQATSFGIDDRYGAISPASLVETGATTQRLPLQRSFGTKAYQRESVKWADYIDEKIEIHSPDWTYREETTIVGIDISTDPPALIVNPLLPTPPLQGYTIQSPSYPDNTDVEDMANWKARHAYLSARVDVVDSADETHFEVDPADIDKFRVGAVVQLHNEDFTDLGPETIIVAVDTINNIIETRDESGFTIDNSHYVRFIGFKDGGSAYRWL